MSGKVPGHKLCKAWASYELLDVPKLHNAGNHHLLQISAEIWVWLENAGQEITTGCSSQYQETQQWESVQYQHLSFPHTDLKIPHQIPIDGCEAALENEGRVALFPAHLALPA